MAAQRSLLDSFNRWGAGPSRLRRRNMSQTTLLRPSKVASRLLLNWAHSPRLPKELLLSWDQLHSEFFGLFRKPFKSSVFILFFVSLLPNIEVFPTQRQQTVNE